MAGRQSNAGTIQAPQALAEIGAEMAALDALGPLTRRAITEAPIAVLAAPILAQIQTHNAKGGRQVDVREAEVDRHLALAVGRLCYSIIAKDRDEHDAVLGLRPLRARRVRRR